MIIFPIGNLIPKRSNAYGATLGQEHLKPLQVLICENFSIGTSINRMPIDTILVDFNGIESTTASYLKAFLIPIWQYGLVSNKDMASSESSIIQSPRIYPMVCGLNDEIREEIDEVFRPRNLPCLEALEWQYDQVTKARLLGGVDQIWASTFQLLLKEKKASAASLHAKYLGEDINITGWNNRLADLHRLRLATRSKQGRQWIYEPLVSEVIYG